MLGSSFDEDAAIAFVAGTLAALCAVMAVRAFVRGGIGAGIAWAAGGAMLAFVAFFFATFTIRLFWFVACATPVRRRPGCHA